LLDAKKNRLQNHRSRIMNTIFTRIAILTILAFTITNCSHSPSGWPCQTGNWTDPITERCGAVEKD